MLLWIALGVVLLVCLVAMLHPNSQTASQLVASVYLALQHPFTVTQNSLTAAAINLRGAANHLFSSENVSARRAFGAFIHLVVFVLLASCGLYLTLLTIAPIFGMKLSWSPPASIEQLSTVGFIVALSFLVAVFLEMIGLSHFGLWDSIQPRIKPLALAVLMAAIVLGISLIVWMGRARWYAGQMDDQQIQQLLETSESDGAFEGQELDEAIQSLTTSPEESENTKRVTIGLPAFIDFAAAVAFFGAILSLQIIGACLVWLLSVAVQIVNIPITIAAQVIDAIGNALIAVVDFFSDLGRRFGWQEELSQNQQVSSQGQQQSQQQTSAQSQQTSGQHHPSPIGQTPNQQQSQIVAPLPLANPGGNGGEPPAPQAENDGNFPEPELTPIGVTPLDPLGLSDNHEDENETGGMQQ